ncbi:MAG: glycosyltransferase family 4 protein, partial [Microthrixaceae bacterium]
AVVATMWTTAYIAAVAPAQRRRFYLVQDFEPGFYPGGTLFALAEETYRLGLYGICNTEPIQEMYTQRYGGTGGWFLPAVDRDVFHPPEPLRIESRSQGDPIRIFVYARPGHWRNCWEIALPALQALKEAYGEGIHIVTAGSWASPEDLGGGIEHLGLLDVRSTGELYRTCDIGVALTVSEHPSYLPGELMACGVPVVAFDLPEAEWILRHEETGLRARQTVGGLREQLARLVVDPDLRERCARGALSHIDARHSDWDAALAHVWDLLCDPGDQP